MPTPTQRVRLIADGNVFDTFTDVEVTRDMSEFAGSFNLRCLEPVRARSFLSGRSGISSLARAQPGGRVSLQLDGELVLEGWIDQVRLTTAGEDLECTVQGRDRAGDLVDCAAAPNGPGEYRGVSLTQLVARLAEPFGLTVRAEVDVGAPFVRFGVEPDMLVADAIRRACQQRAVLCLSDGVGGLVITRGGRQRAPAAIRLGEAPIESEVIYDWQQRFGEVIVKGQVEAAAGNRQTTPALNAQAPPLPPNAALPRPAPTPPSPSREARGVLMVGRARDTAVRRYRPRVVLAETQSGGNSVQLQAEWLARVQRSQSLSAVYTVTDWRPSAQAPLWRPNQIAEVDDRYAEIAEEMLIAGVTYLYGADGTRTRLRMVGRDAFDLLPEREARQSRREPRPRRPYNTEARNLP